jgi:hypothetical protein
MSFRLLQEGNDVEIEVGFVRTDGRSLDMQSAGTFKVSARELMMACTDERAGKRVL